CSLYLPLFFQAWRLRGFAGRRFRVSGHASVRRAVGAVVVVYASLAPLPTTAAGEQSAPSQATVTVSGHAREVHDRAIVIDTHADPTQRMILDRPFDGGMRHRDGNIDIPRMGEGGLDALFFSIWVPSEVTGPPAVKRAMDQIDAVREAVRLHSTDLVL